MSGSQFLIIFITNILLMLFGIFIYARRDSDFVNRFCGAYCFVGGILMLIVSLL